MARIVPVAGTLLLLPPLVGLFARPDITVFGIPLILAYLMVVWVGIIGITAALAGRLRREPSSGDSQGR